jgi:DNA topoisomerase-2
MTSQIKYTIKNDIQHVLDCSDVYIGDTAPNSRKEYVFDEQTGTITLAQISVPEALIRIFVETLTNAVDNAERSKAGPTPCKTIKVNINLKSGLTSVWNDGNTIPIVKQNSDVGELYIHSLIFGYLRSSSNYGDEEVRELSGKNGVGVKCTNIFSSYFCVTGTDPKRGLHLKQEWADNMTSTQGPVITVSHAQAHSQGITEVKYIPDFARFGLIKYPKEISGLLKKLVIDISALLPDINVWFCDEKIVVKSLGAYSKLYFNSEEQLDSLALKYEGSDVVVVGTTNAQSPISFVNGQITKDGGQHVQSWSKALYSSILEILNKKKDLKLTRSDITPFFQLFVHSRVNKPKFDGQNKNCLKNPKVEASFTKPQMTKILKWHVVNIIKERVLRSKEMMNLKKVESKHRVKVVKIDGYDPANRLGIGSVLIVCEGLSAKAYAVAGIQAGLFEKRGRNFFGILPLRGKFLNVKNVSLTKVGENKVVTDLIRALNLKFGVDYSVERNFQSLNYGKLLILTDADKDGIHIKGLLINFLHELFPSLLTREDFVISAETPIVKTNNQLFYDEHTFEKYRETHPNVHFKYYKGLGTISSKDAPNFFGKKVVSYTLDENGNASIDKVFRDENANLRKTWLSEFNPQESRYCLDTLRPILVDGTPLINVGVSDFMEHEMIKFSYEDCKRSLASCIDGLKESQRKVIYAVRKKFKRSKQDTFIKVAQLSGYVAEQTDYKHGEQNLCETIVKFAQTFVGTNNIPLLEPDGQFGSRLEGGKDSADPRYIYTRPHNLLKYIFREEYDPIFDYTVDGEPTTFFPVIPLILANGSVGIGTGWSCFIPQYSPMQLWEYLRMRLNDQEVGELRLDPHYNHFKGKIKPTNDTHTKYTTYGRMKLLDEHTLLITELPIGMWTDKFKDSCYTLLEKGLVSKVINESTTDEVRFTLKGVHDLSHIKLTSYLHTTNMVLFNGSSVITKYASIGDIFEEYFSKRLEAYQKRKSYILRKLSDNVKLNENKLKFVFKVLNDYNFLKMDDENKIGILENEGFLKMDNSFNYLLSTPIRGFSIKASVALQDTIDDLRAQLDALQRMTVKQIWLRELDEIGELINDTT